VYRPVRIDDHNVTRLADVDGLEGRRQISGERLDGYCRADEAYSLKELSITHILNGRAAAPVW